MDPAAAWSRLPCRTLGGRIPRQFNSDFSFTTSLCRANYSLYVDAHMRTQAGLHIDPGALAAGPGERELEVVVPYTEWALADATLQRAAVLAAGLNVRVRLVAVHSVPYAVSFGCPAAVHAHLVEQLVDLASRCPARVGRATRCGPTGDMGAATCSPRSGRAGARAGNEGGHPASGAPRDSPCDRGGHRRGSC